MSCCSCNNAVGYRFHPTDKELVDHYLWNKALDRDSAVQAIGEVDGDLYDWEPEQLPGFSVQRSNDGVWYLFCRKKPGKRVKRTTKLGYWKLTGKHRHIKANVGIGTKKTLVFYKGRPKGEWTPWVIHEYTLPDSLPNQNGFFLCKLKKKDDEKAGIARGEGGQPSNVADDKISDNSAEINIDELLAELTEAIGSAEVVSTQKSQMYEVQKTSCIAASSLCHFNGDFDGVQNQSSTNEQDELLPVSFTLHPHMQQTPSCIVASSLGDFSGDFDGLQKQSSTNEHDDELLPVSSTLHPHMQQTSSCIAASSLCDFSGDFDGLQKQSSTNEQDDELLPVTNEQDDELLPVFSTLHPHMQQTSSCIVASSLCDFSSDFDGLQKQSSTNEQDDELLPVSSTLHPHVHEKHAPSCNGSSHFFGYNGNIGEEQNQSSTNEEDDEFLNNLLADEDDAYPDETSNQLLVGNQSSDLLFGINNLSESSSKQPCLDGLNGVTETEVSQERVKKRRLI